MRKLRKYKSLITKQEECVSFYKRVELISEVDNYIKAKSFISPLNQHNTSTVAYTKEYRIFVYYIIVESKRQEFLRCGRDKQRIALERSLKNRYELYSNLNEASLRKAQYLRTVSSAQRERQKQKLEGTIQFNKRVEEKLNLFQEAKKASAQQRISEVLKRQKEMNAFFMHKLERERSIQLHSQSLHLLAAKKNWKKKQSQERMEKANSIEVEHQLNEIRERLNKSLNAHETFKRSKAERSMILNQRLDNAKKKLNMTYGMRNILNSFTVAVSKSQAKLLQSTKYQSPTANKYKSYKECFQHKEDMEWKVISNAEKEIQEKEKKFKVVCERNKEKVREKQELLRIKRDYHEENIERMKAKEFVWRKEILEKLKIPLKAYPGIAKLFCY